MTEKGQRRPTKRSLPNIPPKRSMPPQLAAARCPACQKVGARRSQAKPGWLWCSWCDATWTPDSAA